ncbi:MAG: hypothetical protein ABI824_13695 [Acidobacteriota bacterium]
MLRSNPIASSLVNILRANPASYSRVGSQGSEVRSRVGPVFTGTGAGRAIATNTSSDPFAAQLTQAIEGYLKSSGQSASLNTPLQIQITPQGPLSPNSITQGSRQFLVTVSQPDATATSVTSTVAPMQTLGAGALAAAASISADAALAGAVTAPPPAPTNEVDAYWATQPPAVQVLRTLNTETERGAKAQELAKQGYSIDVPIMVWGYDPLATMITRKSEGYTWTPSMGQPDPQTPPGISFAGLQSYDPTKPPVGSIKVSTDFGIGLEKTSPWASAFSDMVLS